VVIGDQKEMESSMTVAVGKFVNGKKTGKLEMPVVKEWFADKGDATLRLDYPLNADSVVLDVGGYEGNWAAQIRERYGCKVHVFEPMPAFAKYIRERFLSDEGILVHTYGLSDATATADISVAKDGSSVHKGGGGETCMIKLRRAADVFSELGLSRVDLMKINIEGCEYELLEHLCASGAISRIENVQVQFHDFVPEAAERMARVQEMLGKTHELSWQYRFVWENWKRK
jgi:FkbM family methyltransferase